MPSILSPNDLPEMGGINPDKDISTVPQLGFHRALNPVGWGDIEHQSDVLMLHIVEPWYHWFVLPCNAQIIYIYIPLALVRFYTPMFEGHKTWRESNAQIKNE